MKRKTLPVMLVLLLVLSYAPLAFAQTASSNDWTVVQQLKTDERLIVRQKDGKQFKGAMIEATDTTLTIDRDGKPFGIARTDVRQVSVIEGKAQKGKWALIGAGIGAGAGAGIGAVSGVLFGQSTRKRVMVYDAR